MVNTKDPNADGAESFLDMVNLEREVTVALKVVRKQFTVTNSGWNEEYYDIWVLAPNSPCLSIHKERLTDLLWLTGPRARPWAQMLKAGNSHQVSSASDPVHHSERKPWI